MIYKPKLKNIQKLKMFLKNIIKIKKNNNGNSI